MLNTCRASQTTVLGIKPRKCDVENENALKERKRRKILLKRFMFMKQNTLVLTTEHCEGGTRWHPTLYRSATLSIFGNQGLK